LKIRQFIRHGDYDAVISFLEGANFFCEVAGIPFRKWKLVVGERIADPQILKLPKLIIYRWFHFFADYIVGNSKANLELVRLANPFLRRSKCKLIYNIIDFQKWKPTTDYQPRQNSKIKLIIGSSHCYRKNLVGFVKALLLLSKQELNEFTVDWYGDRLTEPYYDNSYAEARKIIEENGLENIISFFPATHEIHQRVQESDVVGLFSFAEGFPNIICEGMACAKPVICSAISDFPEIISDDSRLLLFNPGDPQSIKEAISYLLSLDNKQLIKIGLKNQRKAKDLFEKEFIISSYLDLLGK
jgi:glycosyltransferase involved in cell wall biosynthesis